MSNYRAAHRYASALLALTKEQKKPNELADDLFLVKNSIDGSRELRSVLASPIVHKDQKKKVLAEIFKKKIGAPAAMYLAAIVDKRREDILHDILKQYFALRDEELGIVRVEVKTSVEFSAKQEKELQKHIETISKKKVEITFTLDSSLKGGFIARVGDTVLDGSVRRQLELMKIRLKQGEYNN
ncbi:MAG: ATP synthase F1 subunit delta [Bacteroidetes bacterium]|nr:ATP synthase F1 subunit delta [Bacteroidota bacterium]